MKTTVILLLTGLLVAALSAAAFPQQQTIETYESHNETYGRGIDTPSSRTMVRAPKPEVDIVVVRNTTADLHMNRYKAFEDFAAQHPEIASALGRNPKLIDNPGYLSKHSEPRRIDEQPSRSQGRLRDEPRQLCPAATRSRGGGGVAAAAMELCANLALKGRLTAISFVCEFSG